MKCEKCGREIIVGKMTVPGRGVLTKYSCFCGDQLDDWNLLSDDEKLVRCSNSMVHYLDEAELEKYAEFERIEQETQKEMAALVELARARKPLTDWQDAVNPEEERILVRLPHALREAVRQMEPQELGRYRDLCRQCGDAQLALADFMRIASERAKE